MQTLFSRELPKNQIISSKYITTETQFGLSSAFQRKMVLMWPVLLTKVYIFKYLILIQFQVFRNEFSSYMELHKYEEN